MMGVNIFCTEHSMLCSFSTPRLNLVITHGLSCLLLLSATIPIHTVNRHPGSSEFIRSRPADGVHRRESAGAGLVSSSPQGSSKDRCCLLT